jgi:hypothetical protein
MLNGSIFHHFSTTKKNGRSKLDDDASIKHLELKDN